MDYIEKLHCLRREKGWSVRELGLRCELSEASVRSILYKKRAPLVSSIKKICDTLDVSLSELFRGADEVIIDATTEITALLSAYGSLLAESKNYLLLLLNSLP